MARAGGDFVRRGANVLLFVGTALAVFCGVAESRVYVARRETGGTYAAHPNAGLAADGAGSPRGAAPPHAGAGWIRIPQLSLDAPITDGVGAIDLIQGVGHVPGTAVAGGLGTMGLAGHRDTFFRALRRARVGMNVFVTGSDGTYRYVVDRIELVDPSRVDVLGVQREPQLVLVTCYPFTYLGAAPRRFVVYARLSSAASDDEPGQASH